MKKISIFYATRSDFKQEEISIICAETKFRDDKGNDLLIGDLINFEITSTPTEEPLEIDLEAMVKHKVRSAFRSLLAPCIVEHAGLVLDAYRAKGFPGGLTQPIWDALDPDEFLRQVGGMGARATARAVIGYCDGKQVHTFTGETRGVIGTPSGDRAFYWDTIFMPDGFGNKTYADIVASDPNGLSLKMQVSQSAKAMSAFASFLSNERSDGMFSGL